MKLEGVIRGPWGSPQAPRRPADDPVRVSWYDWSCLWSSWALRGDLLKAVCSALIRFFSSLPQHVHGSPQRPARGDPHDTIHTVKTIRKLFFRPFKPDGFEELLEGFWDPWVVLGVPRGTLGVPGEAMEGPLGILGGPLGTLGGPLGGYGGASGEPRGSPGGDFEIYGKQRISLGNNNFLKLEGVMGGLRDPLRHPGDLPTTP